MREYILAALKDSTLTQDDKILYTFIVTNNRQREWTHVTPKELHEGTGLGYKEICNSIVRLDKGQELILCDAHVNGKATYASDDSFKSAYNDARCTLTISVREIRPIPQSSYLSRP
jgi:hypothetical protein